MNQEDNEHQVCTSASLLILRHFFYFPFIFFLLVQSSSFLLVLPALLYFFSLVVTARSLLVGLFLLSCVVQRLIQFFLLLTIAFPCSFLVTNFVQVHFFPAKDRNLTDCQHTCLFDSHIYIFLLRSVLEYSKNSPKFLKCLKFLNFPNIWESSTNF